MPIIQSYPDAAAGLCFICASIAISRIVLGIHFLSDVAAGAALGILLGTFAST